MHQITDAQKQQFKEEGYFILENAIPRPPSRSPARRVPSLHRQSQRPDGRRGHG